MSMGLSRRLVLAGAAALPVAPAGGRRAVAQVPTLRIGVLTDLSGPYQDVVGPFCIAGAQQAAQDFGAAVKVEIVSADHQNKADVASGIVRQWFDRDGVDVVADGGSSAVALAVSGVAAEKNKVLLASGGATSDLTGSKCNANTIHWAYDTYMLARSTGGAMVKAGGDSWFFITANYSFGQALQRDVTGFVQAAGGRVIGAVSTPFPGTTDFSSFLLQAQASGARVIGLANAGTDTTNCIKQAREFGITQKLGGLLVFISDVHSLGLEVAQGLVLSESFYWDLNDRTRAFAERMKPRTPGKRPGMAHAGVYSSVLHYLKAAQAMGPAKTKADGAAAVATMKAMPTDDDCFGAGVVRADGRKTHPSYLFEVKKPSESRAPYDYYKLLATTPANEAFRPLSDNVCALVKA